MANALEPKVPQAEESAHAFGDELSKACGFGNALAPPQGSFEPTESARAPVANELVPEVPQAKPEVPEAKASAPVELFTSPKDVSVEAPVAAPPAPVEDQDATVELTLTEASTANEKDGEGNLWNPMDVDCSKVADQDKPASLEDTCKDRSQAQDASVEVPVVALPANGGRHANAFSLWCADLRQNRADEYAAIRANAEDKSARGLAKKLGNAWRGLSDEERARFQPRRGSKRARDGWPKQPANAYQLWCADLRQNHTDEYAAIRANAEDKSGKGLAKKLGDAWRGLNEEARASFVSEGRRRTVEYYLGLALHRWREAWGAHTVAGNRQALKHCDTAESS